MFFSMRTELFCRKHRLSSKLFWPLNPKQRSSSTKTKNSRWWCLLMFVICSNSSIHNSQWKSPSRTVRSPRAAFCAVCSALVTGLIHLSEKYLIETLRNECKKYVYNWLHDLEMTNLDEKKDFVPRHILYKDGTRKHIAAEIGNSVDSERERRDLHHSVTPFHLMTALLSSHPIWIIIFCSGTLCAWFHEYSSRDDNLASSILNLLKHASTDDLERNETFSQLTDREKSLIYKMLSEYLEQQSIVEKNPLDTSPGLIHHKQSASLMFASGDAWWFHGLKPKNSVD